MSKERAQLNLEDDDDFDLTNFQPKQRREGGRPDPKIIQDVAEESGFTSRAIKGRRKRRKLSPYQIQLNLKCRGGVKALFQELGDRLDIHDHTTFERALLALIEKEGYTDLAASFKDLTK